MTTSTIPASQIVSVNPGVVGAGGNPLVLNGVVISPNTLIPSNTVQPFGSVDGVSQFFGPGSAEEGAAEVYFLGNDNSTIKPGTIYFAPYNVTATKAWNQSGSFAGVSLATLQTLSGSLIIVMDGYTRTASSINLSAATSFTNAASLIQTGLNAGLANVATSSASTIAGTTLTVGGTLTGTFAPGQTLVGSGVTATSIILAQLTGTSGGAGTYSLSQSSTIGSSQAINAAPTPVVVSWNAVNSTFTITSGASGVASTSAFATGTVSDGLHFTSATGAILSQGAVADTPTSAANNIKANTQNWATFTTLVEPSLAHKLLYAQWANAQNQRYLYVGWDTDVQATVANTTEPFGYLIKQAEYNGVAAVYNTLNLAMLFLGTVACINFAQQNGRTTLAFRKQSGFQATVTNEQIAINLLANGYSFYGAYATANDQFNWIYNGQMPGEWLWVDTFVNQIYLNSQFQLALMTLLQETTSIPYNEQGYSLIRAAMNDPIQAGLNFGSIRAGVTLSSEQAAVVNQAAGQQISSIIENQGYFLQILDPGSIVRGQRGTPVINFWYTDGGSVQKITLASIDII